VAALSASPSVSLVITTAYYIAGFIVHYCLIILFHDDRATGRACLRRVKTALAYSHQTPRLRNDLGLYCVEWDVKLYYTIPYHTIPCIPYQTPRQNSTEFRRVNSQMGINGCGTKTAIWTIITKWSEKVSHLFPNYNFKSLLLTNLHQMLQAALSTRTPTSRRRLHVDVLNVRYVAVSLRAAFFHQRTIRNSPYTRR